MYLHGEVRELRTSDDGKMVFATILEQTEMVSAFCFADTPGLAAVAEGDVVKASVRVKVNGKGTGVSVQLRQVEVVTVAGELAAVS